MKKQIRPRAIAIPRKFPCGPVFSGNHMHGTQLSAVQWNAISRRALWNLLLFLLVSMAALSVQDFNLFAAVSEDFWPVLGAPPSPLFIDLTLAIYVFAALILLPDRLTKASPGQGWAHVVYRSIFYFFFLASNALASGFLVVLAAGLMLYGLEQAFIWSHLLRARQEE